MNILYLKYAVEIAKTGSVNKAAESLYIAQPNLSRAIKELEASLGVVLFERTSKGMKPTPDGEKLIQYAKNILNQVDELETMFKNENADRITFSISVPRASYISHAFAEFSKKITADKEASVFYKETNSHRTLNNLLNSDYKLGILRFALHHELYFKKLLDEKELHSELITDFTYVLVMSKQHCLAEKETISFDDLRPYMEIAHADPFVPSLPFAQVQKEEFSDDIKRRIFVFERAGQFDLLSANPETFMWVSPIPEELLDRYGLVQKKCADNTRVYKDILIYRNGYKLTKTDKAFISELKKARDKYIVSDT